MRYMYHIVTKSPGKQCGDPAPSTEALTDWISSEVDILELRHVKDR